jgi:hypothetical protein
MKKIFFVLLAVLLVAVSCSDYNVDDTASVIFGRLEAKGGLGTVSGSVAEAENLFWYYTAERTDDGPATGETETETPIMNTVEREGYAEEQSITPGFANKRLSGFAPGTWTFTIYGYINGKADDNLVYKGVEKNQKLVAGETSTISFSVEIVDGSRGTLVTVAPGTIASLDNADYKITLKSATLEGKTFPVIGGEGEDKASPSHAFAKVDNSGDANNGKYVATTKESVPQGLWTLVYGFEDRVGVQIGPDVTVSALILNGAVTTVTIEYNAELACWEVQDITEPTVSDWTKAYSSAVVPEVGDILNYGTYPANYTGSAGTSVAASADYAGKDITWKVLSVDTENNRALVVSEKILFYMKPYTAAQNTDSSANTYFNKYTYKWSDCDINTYLNGSFLTDYGLSGVSMASVEHTTEAGAGIGYTTQAAETTSEKVFLLSVAEANSYFASDSDKVAYDLSGSAAAYWLRSPSQATGSSYKAYSVVFVRDSGSLFTDGDYVRLIKGVRPAMWVTY